MATVTRTEYLNPYIVNVDIVKSGLLVQVA